MLVLFLRIYGFEVRDPCRFLLDPAFAMLFNDFRKKVEEKSREFDMLVQTGKKIGCNL